MRNAPSTGYRFSGHEKFPCRYAWLPKAASEVAKDPDLFFDEDAAMVTLGVGKNMVKSIRFWSEATEVIARAMNGGYDVTPFGRELLLGTGRKTGLDPFIEDIRTLWLIHWKLSVNRSFRIFAWDFFLNRWHDPEISASAAFSALRKEVKNQEKAVSDSILHQQYDIFLHSYVPTRSRKGAVREDNLDCPLVELGLLRYVGLRQSSIQQGRPESVYTFRRDRKPDISDLLFAFCLDEYWRLWHPEENTLSFNLVLNGSYSPGQVFKLPEDDIRARCESLASDTDGFFEFHESALQPMVVRKQPISESIELARVYEEGL